MPSRSTMLARRCFTMSPCSCQSFFWWGTSHPCTMLTAKAWKRPWGNERSLLTAVVTLSPFKRTKWRIYSMLLALLNQSLCTAFFFAGATALGLLVAVGLLGATATGSSSAESEPSEAASVGTIADVVAPAADGCLACYWNCCGCTKETFCLPEPGGRPRLSAGAGAEAAGMGATRGLFAEPSALAFWSAAADLATLSWGVSCLKKLLMMGWLWKNIL